MALVPLFGTKIVIGDKAVAPVPPVNASPPCRHWGTWAEIVTGIKALAPVLPLKGLVAKLWHQM